MSERKIVQTFQAKVKIEDKEVEKTFDIYEPNIQDYREAKKVYNTVFNNAIMSDAPVREKLDEILRKQGLWNDDKEAELTSKQKELIAAEKKLAQGGFKKSEAKALALKMRTIRAEMTDLLTPRTQLDGTSAQGQADNEQFNYLVSVCVVYNDTKQHVFSSLEDYLSRATEDVAIKSAQKLANVLYGVDEKFERNLPENRFLRSFGFVNENLQLINENNQLVDSDGRLIDKDGNFINENGEKVDKFGNRVDDNGDYLVEFQPFLDDDGNPVEGSWDYGVNKKQEPKVEKEPKEVASEEKEVVSTN